MFRYTHFKTQKYNIYTFKSWKVNVHKKCEINCMRDYYIFCNLRGLESN